MPSSRSSCCATAPRGAPRTFRADPEDRTVPSRVRDPAGRHVVARATWLPRRSSSRGLVRHKQFLAGREEPAGVRHARKRSTGPWQGRSGPWRRSSHSSMRPQVAASRAPARRGPTTTVKPVPPRDRPVRCVTALASSQVRFADPGDRESVPWLVPLSGRLRSSTGRHRRRRLRRPHPARCARSRQTPTRPSGTTAGGAARYGGPSPTCARVPRQTAQGWPSFVSRRTIRGVRRRAYDSASQRTTAGSRRARAAPGGSALLPSGGAGLPDHVMVFIGPSRFEADGQDWVVYHTGPLETVLERFVRHDLRTSCATRSAVASHYPNRICRPFSDWLVMTRLRPLLLIALLVWFRLLWAQDEPEVMADVQSMSSEIYTTAESPSVLPDYRRWTI